MQQTAIDRWLRKEFVYVHKIYCNTLPPVLPDKVELEEAEEGSSGLYRYCFTARNDRQLSELTALLEVSSITYTSRVHERGGAVGRLFNNPNQSFTSQVAWAVLVLAIVAFAFSSLPGQIWAYLMADSPTPASQAKKPSARATALAE